MAYSRNLAVKDNHWLSWMTFMDDFIGWLSWMTFMDDIHGWLSWMTFMDDCHGFLGLFYNLISNRLTNGLLLMDLHGYLLSRYCDWKEFSSFSILDSLVWRFEAKVLTISKLLWIWHLVTCLQWMWHLLTKILEFYKMDCIWHVKQDPERSLNKEPLILFCKQVHCTVLFIQANTFFPRVHFWFLCRIRYVWFLKKAKVY